MISIVNDEVALNIFYRYGYSSECSAYLSSLDPEQQGARALHASHVSKLDAESYEIHSRSIARFKRARNEKELLSNLAHNVGVSSRVHQVDGIGKLDLMSRTV